MSAVSVTVEDLKKGISRETLNDAFGPESLGIIVVSGLPDNFALLRMKVLTSISSLANLPGPELERLERSEAMWLTGWSRGREKLQGVPDFNKGSFYVNCAFCKDSALEAPADHIRQNYPQAKMYTQPNVWPDLPGLETFEKDCKSLCKMIVEIAGEVAKNCDRYIESKSPGYRSGFLEQITRNSTCSKARLLHYYPTVSDLSDWCGEHIDHSCLTGLTSALYMDNEKILQESPDENAGLYIRDRRGEVKKVSIPADCLAFQSGSALQEISQNSFRAVPHYVKGSEVPGISRNTLAVFCQPDLDEKITETEDFSQFAQRVVNANH